jgi:hypothetical protein
VGGKGFLATLGMTMGVILVASAARAQTTDVALGIEALTRRDVKGAETAFRRGTTADNPLIRPAAWQWLGHVAWKFRGDTTAAKRYLNRALVEARDSSQILLEIARLNGARKRYHDAVRVAYDAMSRSGDAERRGVAVRTLVELAVDGAFAGRRAAIADSVDLTVVAVARDTLARRVARFPGRGTDARALIDAAALLGDSAAALSGIQSYYRLGQDLIFFDFSTIPQRLRHGQFHESAALYLRATRENLGSAEWSELIAYAGFLHDVRAAVESVYRAELAGVARVGDVSRAINLHGRRLWPRLQHRGKPADFYPAALYRAIAQRFGTSISVERSRGVDELYLGHWIQGRPSNSGMLVVMDAFVASGIDNWLLDGTGGRAGWVSADTVYERRSAFTETPFRALLALTDPQTIPGELFRITRDSVGDIERARRDSLGYFPGVAARVFRSGAQALLDSVKTPEAFTRAMFDNLTHTSIELHEGRHRSDARANPSMSPAEAEFRAKLDEVTGAALPRLAFTAILSPTIGDSSPHGQANRRIMIGLNRWIRQNGVSIAGYDARVPALLQLPLLTDAQLRAAVNSMRVR